MGWRSHELPNKDYQLWTNGGIDGVFIRRVGEENPEIDIPAELLIMLVADSIRSKRISELEQMEDNEVINLDGE